MSGLLRPELRDGCGSSWGWLGIEQRVAGGVVSITEPSLQLCIEFPGVHSTNPSVEDF